MLKKRLICLFFIIIIFVFISCGRNKSLNKIVNTSSSNDDESTNTLPIQYDDDIKIDDTSKLPYKSIYSSEFDNYYELVLNENNNPNRINYEEKKRFENEANNYLKYFGINNFKLPNSKSYEFDFLDSQTIVCYDVLDDISEYSKYLDDTFKDFKKSINDFEGLSKIFEALTGNSVSLNTESSSSYDLRYLDYTYETRYNKEVKNLTYSVTYKIQSGNIYLTFSPRGIDKWINWESYDNYDKPFINKLNNNMNHKITLHSSGYGYNYDKGEYEYIDKVMDVYKFPDGSFYFRDSLYSSYFYIPNSNGYTRYSVSDDIVNINYGYDVDIDYVKKEYNNALGFTQGYVSSCHQEDTVWRVKYEMFAYFNDYELEEYLMYKDRYCFKVKNKPNYNFPTISHELIVDLETGYCLEYNALEENYEYLSQKADIEFGEYNYLINSDGQLKITSEVDNNTYNVKFKDYNVNIIKNENVKANGGIIPPKEKIIENYKFLGYDYNYYNIREDIIINPIYKKLEEYTVKFKDFKGNVIKEEKVLEGSSVTPPDLDLIDGYKFYSWDYDTSYVISDLVVNPIYIKLDKHNVKFLDYDNSVILDTYVYDGQKVEAPTPPKHDGYTFIGWSNTFDEVYNDLIIYAKYKNNDNNNQVGSISFFIDYHLQIINKMESEEDKVKYMMELSDNIALSSSSNQITESMLNEGKAVSLIYPHAQILNSYGALLVKAGYEKTAIEYFENAVKLDPYNYIYNTNLAEMLFKYESNEENSNYEHALFFVNEALKYNQNYGPAMQLKAAIYLKQNRYSEALEELLYSSKYIWNETSIGYFNSLYKEISNAYNNAKFKAEMYSYGDEYIIDYVNPLEKYLDLVYEVIAVQKENVNGLEYDFKDPITVSFDVYPNYYEYANSEIEEMKNNLDIYIQRINFSLVNAYENTENNNYVGLVDSRTYIMAKFIDQYYSQKIEIQINKYNRYGKTEIDHYIHKSDDSISWQGVYGDMTEAVENEELDRLEALLSKYYNGNGDFNDYQFKLDMVDSFKDTCDLVYSEYTDEQKFFDNIKKEAFNTHLSDIYDEAYYGYTYCMNAFMNNDLANYFYSLFYEQLYDMYSDRLSDLSYFGFEMALFKTVLDECVDIASQGLLGVPYQDTVFSQQESEKAPEPEKNEKSSDLSAGLQLDLGLVQLGVSYSLVSGEGELTFDSPFVSKSYVYDSKSGNSTSTTLYYSFSYGSDCVYDYAKGKAKDKVMDTIIPGFSEIPFASTDQRLGYGTQVTRNSSGKVIEDSKIIQASSSYSQGSGSLNVSSLYKVNSISSQISLDSIKLETNFHGVTISTSGELF